MKPYIKLIVIYLFLLMGTFLTLRLLAVWVLDRPMDTPVWVTSIAWVVLFSMIYWGVLIQEFKPRLEYINHPGTEPPEFKVVVTRKLEIPESDFSFQRLHEELLRQYEVTYCDEENQVLKLRDRFSVSSWGACTFIQYLEKEGTLFLASYPMSNRTMKQGSAGKRQNEAIAEIIQQTTVLVKENAMV